MKYPVCRSRITSYFWSPSDEGMQSIVSPSNCNIVGVAAADLLDLHSIIKDLQPFIGLAPTSRYYICGTSRPGVMTTSFGPHLKSAVMVLILALVIL